MRSHLTQSWGSLASAMHRPLAEPLRPMHPVNHRHLVKVREGALLCTFSEAGMYLLQDFTDLPGVQARRKISCQAS